MTAVDTNVLVYAHRADMPQHAEAFRRLSELMTGGGTWAIPWPCVHEFYNVVTNPRRFRTPTPIPDALEQVRRWRSHPEIRLISEADDHFDRLVGLVRAGQVVGPKVHDARIAAICLSRGVTELWSTDRDFSLFPQLKCVNPLLS